MEEKERVMMQKWQLWLPANNAPTLHAPRGFSDLRDYKSEWDFSVITGANKSLVHERMKENNLSSIIRGEVHVVMEMDYMNAAVHKKGIWDQVIQADIAPGSL